MSPQHPRPKWWQMYLTLPLLIVLFLADSRLKISTRGHQVVQIGILLIVYGLMYLWVKANARALRALDRLPYNPAVRVLYVGPYELPDSGKENKRSGLELPDSEIAGVLSDTFEMNIIDAQALPVDEVPHELNKE